MPGKRVDGPPQEDRCLGRGLVSDSLPNDQDQPEESHEDAEGNAARESGAEDLARKEHDSKAQGEGAEADFHPAGEDPVVSLVHAST